MCSTDSRFSHQWNLSRICSRVHNGGDWGVYLKFHRVMFTQNKLHQILSVSDIPPPSTFLNTSRYRRGNFRQNSHHIILRHWIVIFGYRWSYESAGCVDQLYTCISCVIEPADSTISKNKNSIHIFTSFWVIHCVKYSLIF